jgi:two-component system sensor histidine kinase DegS
MPANDTPIARLLELSGKAEKERTQLDVELREIEILLKQTSGEIEKLQQRQTDAAARLRQVEANMEAYSRSDIKTAYASAQEAQMRLFVMKNQLEQLQNRQRAIARYISELEKMITIMEQVSEVTASAAPSDIAGPETFDRGAIVRIIEAQEMERQRLSRQMHDGPAQSLTNLILQAEIVERLFDSDPPRARTELSNLKNSANTTFQRVRDFIFDLRPMMLDDLGLTPTLKRYIQTFESKTQLTTQLNALSDRPLPPHMQVTLFRTVQELLKNAARHAHATRVQISLDLQPDPVIVTVEDNGTGFDPQEVLPAARQRSTGLANVEKRIEMLGGRTYIQSGAGRGTRVRVELPTS